MLMASACKLAGQSAAYEHAYMKIADKYFAINGICVRK